MSKLANYHWSAQRFSAIALIFLSSFSIYKVFDFINSGEPLINIFNMPFSLLMIILFVIIGLYHASLGIEVILEDYISCGAKRGIINSGLKLLNIATIGFLLISMFYGYSRNFTLNDESSTKPTKIIEQANENTLTDDMPEIILPTKTIESQKKSNKEK
jgi:succinate dehydrogenase / fumarate reductase membrane anchor subunit